MALTNVLREDLRRSALLSADTNDEFYRRTYVRAVFAFVEGTLSGTDRYLVDAIDLGAANAVGWSLRDEEVQTLSDSLQRPRKDGRRPRFLMVEPHVKVIVAIGERLFGGLQMSFNGGDWANFQEAVKIRNRLMHPRTVSDLSLSPQDVIVCDAARDWFRFGMQRWLGGALKDFQAFTERLRRRS